MAFSSFKNFISKKLLQENDLCLFFKKDGIIYGATENSRITYARMKNPESKEDEAWKKEASFTAYDLEKSTDKEKVRRPFSHKEVNDIELISQEKAEKQLEKKGKKIIIVSEDDDEQTYGEE